ncbi:MAG: hypothetical protein IKX34_08560 [Bacteroidales bacterium]|nr:hypothetical protein [Bacteroidales bacterium]
MDFKKLTTRFRQFGGLRLLKEYAKTGALRPAMKAFCRCIIKRQSFKAIYPEVLKTIVPFLEKRYHRFMLDRKRSYQLQEFEHQRHKIIWFCWLQGLDDAPPIVKACYASLNCIQHSESFDASGPNTDPVYHIQVIDNNNWREYVELPDYVVRKWEKKQIPAANFSDLLRLELLIKYGGTWIDSTVLCTGFGTQATQKALAFLDADLFLFQYTPEGTANGISISNWFITACTNNEVLMVLRDMLYEYWKEFDCTLDYYMFHLFFRMVAAEYPEQIKAMPYGSSQRSIALTPHWNEPFNQEQWEKLVSKVAFHKLSHRVDKRVVDNKNNYYNYIVHYYL